MTDKVLIAAPLLWLASSGGLPLWAVWVLLARELLRDPYFPLRAARELHGVQGDWPVQYERAAR